MQNNSPVICIIVCFPPNMLFACVVDIIWCIMKDILISWTWLDAVNIKNYFFSYYFMLICKRCCSSIAPRRFATYSSTAIDVLRTHVSLWESTKRSDKTVQTVWRWVIRNSYTCRCWFNCYCLWGIASTGDCSSCEGLCNDLAIHHCGYLCFIIHEFNLMLVILLFYIYICLVFRKYTRRLLVTLINDSLLFCIITG